MPPVSSRSKVSALRQPVGLASSLAMTHLLEAGAELLGVRKFDRAWDLVVGQALAAEGHHTPLEQVHGLRRPQLEARSDDLSHHGLRFAEDRDIFHVFELQ